MIMPIIIYEHVNNHLDDTKVSVPFIKHNAEMRSKRNIYF